MIEIKGLTKAYGETVVLDGIDLTVADGQIAAVVGPSGAGKSTLARCINFLERPTSGRISVTGQDLTQLRGRDLIAARREIGTVFQQASLLRRLTAAQNVALPMRYLGLTPAEQRTRVGELLERVGMLHRANHYPAQLSGGQRQRIGLARGLALRPSVLLSDEATSGLDPEATRSILDLVRELRDDLGVTFLVITHEMDVVRTVADQVFQLDDGRIVESGPVSEVVRRSDSALSTALLPTPPARGADGRLRSWQVRYRDTAVDPAWISRLGQALGSPVSILAALVEEVGTEQVGRLTIGLDPGLDERRVSELLTNLGLSGSPTPGLVAAVSDERVTA